MNKIVLIVKGMSCEHCKKTVKNLLIDERGVKQVDVDLATGHVLVTGDEKMSKSQLVNAVNLSGIYQAQCQ